MKISAKRNLMASLVFMGLVVSGCGKGGSVKNLVNGIQGRGYTMNGDIYVEVSANLNTATYSLASFALPIIDPNNSAIQYGSIVVAPNATGDGGQLRISVNASKAANINSSTDSTLPNGTAFPLAVGSNAIVSIPIGNDGAKIYIVIGPKTILVGSAIPFSVLNEVGKYVPGVNVFAPISSGKVNAFVGVFAGSRPNQTGLGLFADLSQLLPQTPEAASILAASSSAAGVIGSESSAMVAAGSSSASSVMPSKISLKASASKSAEQKLYYYLWKTGQRNPVLRYR